MTDPAYRPGHLPTVGRIFTDPMHSMTAMGLLRHLEDDRVLVTVDNGTLIAHGPADALDRWDATLRQHGEAVRRYIEAMALVDFEE